MSWQRVISLLMVVAVLVTTFSAIRDRRERDAYEARAERTEQVADSLLQLADSALASADEHTTRADSLEQEADGLRAQVRARVAVIREVEVPDTCAPFVAPRDSALDDALAVADAYEAALEESVRAGAAKDVAIASLRVGYDSLATVLRARPKPAEWWKPTIGVTVGACSNGDVPCAAVGLTWSF